jgi:hypothetical protein
MSEADSDPKDYLAMFALGLGPASQPHVWETPRHTTISGQIIWSCKFCKRVYKDDRENETCQEHPPGVARPGD